MKRINSMPDLATMHPFLATFVQNVVASSPGCSQVNEQQKPLPNLEPSRT